MNITGKLLAANVFERWLLVRRDGLPDARVTVPRDVAERMVNALRKRIDSHKLFGVKVLDAERIAGPGTNRADRVAVVTATYHGIYRDIDVGGGATPASIAKAMQALEGTGFTLLPTGGNKKHRPARLAIVVATDCEYFSATNARQNGSYAVTDAIEMGPSDMSGHVDAPYWVGRISPLAND